MTVAAVLVAAGSGSRLGASAPKAFVDLHGEPLFVHAARSIAESGAVDLLIVVVPAGRQREVLDALRAIALDVQVRVGGASRQASVASGLRALSEQIDIVLVHDAARALAPPSLIRSVVASVRAGNAAVVPGLPIADTVKQVGSPDVSGTQPVRATVDRADLRAVQTPQGFDRRLLERAHLAGASRAGSEATAAGDDAGLVEALGAAVAVIAGDPLAFKITGPHDLSIAASLMARAGSRRRT